MSLKMKLVRLTFQSFVKDYEMQYVMQLRGQLFEISDLIPS